MPFTLCDLLSSNLPTEASLTLFQVLSSGPAALGSARLACRGLRTLIDEHLNSLTLKLGRADASDIAGLRMSRLLARTRCRRLVLDLSGTSDGPDEGPARNPARRPDICLLPFAGGSAASCGRIEELALVAHGLSLYVPGAVLMAMLSRTARITSLDITGAVFSGADIAVSLTSLTLGGSNDVISPAALVSALTRMAALKDLRLGEGMVFSPDELKDVLDALQPSVRQFDVRQVLVSYGIAMDDDPPIRYDFGPELRSWLPRWEHVHLRAVHVEGSAFAPPSALVRLASMLGLPYNLRWHGAGMRAKGEAVWLRLGPAWPPGLCSGGSGGGGGGGGGGGSSGGGGGGGGDGGGGGGSPSTGRIRWRCGAMDDSSDGGSSSDEEAGFGSGGRRSRARDWMPLPPGLVVGRAVEAMIASGASASGAFPSGASTSGASAFGASAFGASASGAAAFGASAFGASTFGASAFGASASGAAAFSASGAAAYGASASGASGCAASPLGPTAPSLAASHAHAAAAAATAPSPAAATLSPPPRPSGPPQPPPPAPFRSKAVLTALFPGLLPAVPSGAGELQPATGPSTQHPTLLPHLPLFTASLRGLPNGTLQLLSPNAQHPPLFPAFPTHIPALPTDAQHPPLFPAFPTIPDPIPALPAGTQPHPTDSPSCQLLLWGPSVESLTARPQPLHAWAQRAGVRSFRALPAARALLLHFASPGAMRAALDSVRRVQALGAGLAGGVWAGAGGGAGGGADAGAGGSQGGGWGGGQAGTGSAGGGQGRGWGGAGGGGSSSWGTSAGGGAGAGAGASSSSSGAGGGGWSGGASAGGDLGRGAGAGAGRGWSGGLSASGGGGTSAGGSTSPSAALQALPARMRLHDAIAQVLQPAWEGAEVAAAAAAAGGARSGGEGESGAAAALRRRCGGCGGCWRAWSA
ncbi:hypothetical protein HYH03_007157 [Edaphochlamys debaryana]|uniref:F-box domain-containing protein n=1 Tax=Edaphochlamys debaryana TaxID=47281 RepID=A0A835Y3P8_9CHLO|nr:hypothetical protein HYH03_007157 [Edaphochlamys debaryana]|eukprot:KAG2494639.1 hypothetical protein HYH03_007157 [Edaphochlamys debaryana]